MSDKQKRCAWVNLNKPHYIQYHDEEWGMPVHDDQKLFEMLILEGAQAGLNWETILKKREGYRDAFYQFDVEKVAKMTDQQLEAQLQNQAIIRNRLKVFTARKNARVFMEIQNEFDSFSNYLWAYVDGEPLIGQWTTVADIPVNTPLSDAISKDLKRRGMSFVGSTIMYAYLQAVGVLNDHTTNCFKY